MVLQSKMPKYIRPETPVIHLITMEEGVVLNGKEVKKGIWTSYDVQTASGIKVWKSIDILIRR